MSQFVLFFCAGFRTPASDSRSLCRVSDAGQRQPFDIHRWPASESRQRTNPRGMVRGECRALRYGDLADAEGVRVGARSLSRRLIARLAGGSSSA
jgi:hypothetical protein